jgi:hypothetical protein
MVSPAVIKSVMAIPAATKSVMAIPAVTKNVMALQNHLDLPAKETAQE